MKICVLVLAILAFTLVYSAPTPPIYNYPYRVSFDQAYIVNKTTYKLNGQRFYDPMNNRERIDRTDGRYNPFCGTVLPNVTTPCIQLTINNQHWVYYPQKSTCCFCCDAAHGCGIMKPNWLEDGQYKGQDKIIDTMYDKWSKDGVFGYNYLWVTTDDAKIPRRLDDNGQHMTDYNTHSFHNQTTPFDESIFTPPSYCNTKDIVNCPLSSLCGKLRSKLIKQ